ncbi:MAG TPA: histidine-type phosphatase [Candidatus Angelobacter sp.]
MPSQARYATTRHTGTPSRNSVLPKVRAPWLQWPGGARTLWTHLGAALLLLWLLPPAAQAQAGTPVKPPQVESAPANSDLKLVVALFRHGVRAPTKDFNEEAKQHSGQPWPGLRDWKVMEEKDCDKGEGWAYLTVHGQQLAQRLGAFYGREYKKAWPNGFKVYLWADDENQRTRETARALGQGFVSAEMMRFRCRI